MLNRAPSAESRTVRGGADRIHIPVACKLASKGKAASAWALNVKLIEEVKCEANAADRSAARCVASAAATSATRCAASTRVESAGKCVANAGAHNEVKCVGRVATRSAAKCAVAGATASEQCVPRAKARCGAKVAGKARGAVLKVIGVTALSE